MCKIIYALRFMIFIRQPRMHLSIIWFTWYFHMCFVSMRICWAWFTGICSMLSIQGWSINVGWAMEHTRNLENLNYGGWNIKKMFCHLNSQWHRWHLMMKKPGPKISCLGNSTHTTFLYESHFYITQISRVFIDNYT